MSDVSLANDNCKLLNTKERLIYHLIKVIMESLEDGFRLVESDEAPEATSYAIRYLVQLGYSPGKRWGKFPSDNTRWDFMLDSGEPGTHVKPEVGGMAERAIKIEQALHGMLATLNTAKQSGLIIFGKQIERAIAHANKAIE